MSYIWEVKWTKEMRGKRARRGGRGDGVGDGGYGGGVGGCGGSDGGVDGGGDADGGGDGDDGGDGDGGDADGGDDGGGDGDGGYGGGDGDSGGGDGGGGDCGGGGGDVPEDALTLLAEHGFRTVTQLFNTIYETVEWPTDFADYNICLKEEAESYEMQRSAYSQRHRTYSKDGGDDTKRKD